ncbi:TetR/AcrR family transcriptional regulator [Rhizobium lusitanum]|uniref:TetR/AcrR family transcriptional regulator n=1 Tax=Rhizobium lusitanum TaxID=293958 RepID=UPI00161CF06C|nr:TetR/AcrR family transcriptional regulator [Rhizobium lusitanum]QND48728.1 TetR/AcrR family transcriptional regulator [Rhizobium lusitanum]
MTRTIFEKSDAIALVAEVFRELGYEGASMSSITARTRLSKGSLYHFFPDGKEEMAAEIMANIDAWFVTQMFRPLEEDEPRAAIALMWETTDTYFRSGRRICLIGAFALDETRDRFAGAIRGYFKRWIEALAGALIRGGVKEAEAHALAEEAVVGIQGALMLARALGDDRVFGRALRRLKAKLGEAGPDQMLA